MMPLPIFNPHAPYYPHSQFAHLIYYQTQLLKNDGWYLVRVRGNHHHFKHETKSGIVTVPGNPNMDLHLKTLASIFKQAGLPKEVK